MSTARVEQAVILAAGMGTRIAKGGATEPKPLVRVGGLSLLKRGILTARSQGVRRFVIVVGCNGDQVRDAVAGDPDLADVELVFVENERYDLANGVSVLAARPYLHAGEFFLTMADHIVDKAIYGVLQREPARGGLVLAVDRKLDTIFDMDDATKVRVGAHDSIAAIGKSLTDFDAVDTGVFRCDPALFDSLDRVYRERGNVSLSEGVQALAAGGRARVADVGNAWWQDVDTVETKRHAEKMLFRSLTKVTDGPVSRYINRPVSKTLTRMVMNANVVPNHMTAVGLVLGLASAAAMALVSPANLGWLAVAGVLYQLSSMIDGCDGELARLKFKHSARGEWFDTISDDVINLSYQLAMGFAAYRLTGNALWLQLSLVTFALGWFVAGNLYRKLIAEGKGTHLQVEWSFQQQSNPSWFARFCAKLEFVAHRDFYALVLMFFSIFGLLKLATVLSAVTVGIVFAQWAITTVGDLAAARRAEREPVGSPE
jgi:CDP-L-myo-inositol myo-inositolphosphotransferase